MDTLFSKEEDNQQPLVIQKYASKFKWPIQYLEEDVYMLNETVEKDLEIVSLNAAQVLSISVTLLSLQMCQPRLFHKSAQRRNSRLMNWNRLTTDIQVGKHNDISLNTSIIIIESLNIYLTGGFHATTAQ